MTSVKEIAGIGYSRAIVGGVRIPDGEKFTNRIKANPTPTNTTLINDQEAKVQNLSTITISSNSRQNLVAGHLN